MQKSARNSSPFRAPHRSRFQANNVRSTFIAFLCVGLSKKESGKEGLITQHREQSRLRQQWKQDVDGLRNILLTLRKSYQKSKGGFAVGRYEELKEMIKTAVRSVNTLVFEVRCCLRENSTEIHIRAATRNVQSRKKVPMETSSMDLYRPQKSVLLTVSLRLTKSKRCACTRPEWTSLAQRTNRVWCSRFGRLPGSMQSGRRRRESPGRAAQGAEVRARATAAAARSASASSRACA